jgi:glutathione S-transferase
MARQTDRIHAALDDVERNWASSLNTISVATIALACALGYIDLRHAALNWREHRPKLADFERGMTNRPSLKAWPLA